MIRFHRRVSSAQDTVFYIVTLRSCCILYTFSECCIFSLECGVNSVEFLWLLWHAIFLFHCSILLHVMRTSLIGNSDADERLAVVFSIFLFLWRYIYSKLQVMWALWVFKVCSELVYHIHSYFSSTAFVSELPLGT